MAAINKRTIGAPSLGSNPLANEHIINGYAGEAIGPMDAVYVTSSPEGHNTFFKAQHGVANKAKVHGFASKGVSAGAPLTIFTVLAAGYANPSNDLIGKSVYLSATVAGGLDDTANGPELGFGAEDGVIWLRAVRA